MFSLEYIKAINREKTEQAKEQGLEPYIAEFDGDEGVRSCPFLADYIPEGYELVEKYFVDSSGFGSENEPALTLEQFLRRVKEGFGYAVIESGQFQVYIGEYRRI